jgi:hypothetical protein
MTIDQRLGSLLAQRKMCGGEQCKRPKCKRCARGREYAKRLALRGAK